MIRVLIADDHAILRSGLKALLSTQPDIAAVGDASDGDEAVRLAEDLQPDVMLLDVTMPGNYRLAALRRVRECAPHVRVIVLTMHQDEGLMRESLRLGAAGYLLKRASESDLLDAIRAVARGQVFVDSAMTPAEAYPHQGVTAASGDSQIAGLTLRELEILKLVAQGYANREIAAQLFISVKTVETHKLHVGEKLGVHNRVEMMRYARRHGLLAAGE